MASNRSRPWCGRHSDASLGSVDDLPDLAFEPGWREVPGDGVELAIGVLADALHEPRSHRIRGIERERATELPQLLAGHRLRDQDLPIGDIPREVALHEAAAQPV